MWFTFNIKPASNISHGVVWSDLRSYLVIQTSKTQLVVWIFTKMCCNAYKEAGPQ